MITKEQKIDILSRYCADKIGHGMREKVWDVIKHVVDFLESDRVGEVGVQPITVINTRKDNSVRDKKIFIDRLNGKSFGEIAAENSFSASRSRQIFIKELRKIIWTHKLGKELLPNGEYYNYPLNHWQKNKEVLLGYYA